MHKSLPGEFEAINARLKHEFSLKSDAEVAHLLGLSPQAFYSRKKDNSFPKERLSLFLKNNAEQYSYIDFQYILTGESENEAAEILGLSPNALYERKKKNSFPVEKLNDVFKKNPELNQSHLKWILTGTKELKEEAMSSKEFNLMIADITIKLKVLPRIQQEPVYTIIKEFHKNLH